MSARRRIIRSTFKWGGAAITVQLLIVWVGSAWYAGGFQMDNKYAIAGAGQLHVGWVDPNSIMRIHFEWFFRIDTAFGWWFRTVNDPVGWKSVSIPIWLLVLLTATPTFLIWRRDRKRLPGTCPKCGYDRTGLPADRACPECGTTSTIDLKH